MEAQEDLEAVGGLPAFLRDPRRVVLRRWPWMVASLVLGLAVTAVMVIRMPLSYTASATVLISSQQISEDFVRSTLPEDSFERVNAMIGETLSRDKLSALIEKFGLYSAYRDKVPMSDLAAMMRSRITVDLQRGVMQASNKETARLLVIGFQAGDPKVAADVTNEIASLFVAASIDVRSKQAKTTTQFLKGELDRADAALREQDRKITEFKEAHRGELPSEQEAHLRRLEMLQQQRQSLATQIAEAETRVAMLAANQSSAGTTPDARLENAKAKLAAELSVHTEAHPDVISLRREIKQLEAQVAATESSAAPSGGPSIIAAAQRQVGAMRAQLLQTETELRELDQRVARIPAVQEQLAALEEKAAVLRENYVEFLRKVKEAELAETLESAQQGERFSVIESAYAPDKPDRAPWKMLVAGVFASFAFAAGIGFVLEWWDPVMVDAAHVSAEAGVATLGSVPRIA